MKKMRLIGILGILSFISYFLAVVISPIAYPNYDWMSQAVSDLSAINSPSLLLWNQIASIYNICTCAFLLVLCIYINNKLNKTIRLGIYIFTIMSFISAIGYTMFPLSDNNFINVMHIIVTILVVLLSISSLIIIMIGGYKNKSYLALAITASIILLMMSTSAITGIAPKEIFGLIERFSCLSATGFTAALGIFMLIDFKGFKEVLNENSSI